MKKLQLQFVELEADMHKIIENGDDDNNRIAGGGVLKQCLIFLKKMHQAYVMRSGIYMNQIALRR